MKLYSGPLSMFGAKAEIAALEKGLDFELVMVPFDMKTLYQPKHPEVLRINPKRQVPVLIDGDLEIFDSTRFRIPRGSASPSRRCGRPSRRPGPERGARAQVGRNVFPADRSTDGLQGTPDDAAVAARAAANAFYDGMERRCRRGTGWPATIPIADIAFYMAQIFGDRRARPMIDAHPKLQAWRDRMIARPAVRQVGRCHGRYLLKARAASCRGSLRRSRRRPDERPVSKGGNLPCCCPSFETPCSLTAPQVEVVL